MKSLLKAKLEEVIREFLYDAAEEDLIPNGYCVEDLPEKMVNAAEIVFDTCFESSVYTEEQTS